MHVCLLCTEIFHWGRFGGYGRATRMLGRALTQHGVRVSAVVPLPLGMKEPVCDTLDGIAVYGYPMQRTFSMGSLYRSLDSDVYHSQEPFPGTYMAMRAVPEKVHAVTFQNARNFDDWRAELKFPAHSRVRSMATCCYYENPFVRAAVRRCQGVGIVAEFLRDKVMRKYSLRHPPSFLPPPTDIPVSVHKAARPTACFVGRFDRNKRPELFFQLADANPDVDFIAIGASRDDRYSRTLMGEWELPANLLLTGFINQFQSPEFFDYLSKSWILVNTSVSEGLPNTFIEAAAHKCAILSCLDPEGFTTRFGCQARAADLSQGLGTLLMRDRWKMLGEQGHAYVKDRFSAEASIARHMAFYERALSGKGRPLDEAPV